MRQRIEDLGRLLVLLERVLDHNLFEKMDEFRPKDFLDIFHKWPSEKQDDWIHQTGYEIRSLKDEIAECWSIARGDDYLNETHPGD